MANLVHFFLIVLLLEIIYINAQTFQECQHELLEVGLDSDEVTDIQNDVRKKLIKGEVVGQPQATEESVQMLVRNYQLSKEAAKVAKTCNFEHIRIETSEFPQGLGQNLFRRCSNKNKPVNWRAAVDYWYKENLMYRFSKFRMSRDKPAGHYTQLIWGSTNNTGCAYSKYKRKNSRTPYCTLIVCHYGPMGNIEDEFPYTPVKA